MRIDLNKEEVGFYEVEELIEEERIPSDIKKEIEKHVRSHEPSSFTVSFVKYPEDTPILCSDNSIDGGINISSFLMKMYNLEKKHEIEFPCSDASLLEKMNEGEKAYLLYLYMEDRFCEYYIIEI